MSSINSVDYPPPPDAAASTDYETWKQRKREEREKRRRQEIERYDMDGNAHQNAQTYSPRPTPGTIHSANTDDEEKEDDDPIRLPTSLAAPTDQCAYAESVCTFTHHGPISKLFSRAITIHLHAPPVDSAGHL